MIVNVTVSCPSCAILRGIEKQDVKSSALHLTLFDTGAGNYYTFFCPTCHEEVQKPADDSIVGLLLGYVGSSLVHVPAEITDGDRTGPRLTEDDLMDFLIELNQPGEMRISDEMYYEAAKKVRELA